MTGEFIINKTNNITRDYGIFICAGSYEGLLSYPPAKAPLYNDWAEYDGIEADVSNPVLDTREFDMHFAGIDKDVDVNVLFDFISLGAYHEFTFCDLNNYTRKLRMVSNSTYVGTKNQLRIVTIRFADDYPLEYDKKFTHQPITQLPHTGYALNDIDLSGFGLVVEAGTDSEILKSPAVKPNHSVSFSRIPGITYDDFRVIFSSKDVKLNCVMCVDSVPLFLHNHEALLNQLIKPKEIDKDKEEERKEIMLTVDDLGESYPCYYKNSSITKFQIINGRVWCEMSITLTFTNFLTKNGLFYLMSEDMKSFIADGDEYILIDKQLQS